MSSAVEEGRRLFVGGLSNETTDYSMRAYFSQYFLVQDAQVKRFPDGVTRGFGFVTFPTPGAAEECYNMGPHVLDGKPVELRKATTNAGKTPLSLEMPDPEALVMRKLCLDNLPEHLTEEDLKEYFSHCGEVENVVITKDASKGTSKAKVTFTKSDAVDVAQKARPHTVRGCKVETKRETPTHLVGKPEADIDSVKVFLGPPDKGHKGLNGLGEDTSDQDLSLYFGQFGQVLSIKQCLWEDTGRKRGYGYLEMGDSDQVDKIVLVRIHQLRGRQIEAKKALTRDQMRLCQGDKKEDSSQPRGVKRGRWNENQSQTGYDNTAQNFSGKRPKASPRDPEDQAMRKLFVGNMHTATTLASMQKYFRQFGEVEHCYCATYENTGKCRGYGFITFKTAATADEVQRTRPHTIEERVVDTKRAVPKEWMGMPESEMRSKKLFITGLHGANSGLHDDISDEEVEEFFSKFGKVVNVDQKVWPESGKKRGYGYVEFQDEDAVDKAVLLGVHELKGAILEARKGLTKEQQDVVKRKNEAMALQAAEGYGPDGYPQQGAYGQGAPQPGGWGTGYGAGPNPPVGKSGYGGGGGYAEMQGMMNDMQNKMAGGGGNMGNMMGQMQKMSSMMGTMGGAGGGGCGPELIKSMQGMMQSMSSLMAAGNNPAMASSMQGMMMNMMTMCQQMMTAAAQSSSQNKSPYGAKNDQVGYGGGYGAVGNPNWGGAGGQPGWGAPGAPGANAGQGAQAWNKPGDWPCSCGNSNYQWRDVCNRCQKTKPKEVGAGTTPSTYGNPNWTPKPPAAAPSKEAYNGYNW